MNSTLKKVFEVYVFAFAVLFTARPINDGNFWFRLKTGEYLFKTGTISRINNFFLHELWHPLDRTWLAVRSNFLRGFFAAWF